MELEHVHSEKDTIEAKLKNAAIDAEQLETGLRERVTRLAEAEAALAGLRIEMQELHNEKQQVEAELATAVAGRGDSETRLKEVAERCAQAEDSLAALQAEV